MKKYLYLIIAICMVAIPNRRKDDAVTVDDDIREEEFLFI